MLETFTTHQQNSFTILIKVSNIKITSNFTNIFNILVVEMFLYHKNFGCKILRSVKIIASDPFIYESALKKSQGL